MSSLTFFNFQTGIVMPNWCLNQVKICGPQNQIKNLFENIQETKTFLNVLAPRPEEQDDNWYDWNNSNWHTKWDISKEFIENFEYTAQGETATISGYFDSAWAPPIGAFDIYLENNSEVSIECLYYEPGMGFAGLYDDGEEDYIEDLTNADDSTLKRLNETFEIEEFLEEEDF